MEVLLVEPSIIIDAMFPVILLKYEIVIEDVLSADHFALLPLRLIEPTLCYEFDTLG